MAHSWGTKLVKYTLIGFNLLFVLSGIILIIIGASVKAIYNNYDTFLDDKYFSLPNLLIATGTLIFFISFFGCYGAIKESWLMLYGFIGLLILIFIMEFSGGIAGYVLRDKTFDYLQNELFKDLKEYGHDKTYLIEKSWDIMQKEFQCCGVLGPGDWHENFMNDSLPLSCCNTPYGAINAISCTYNKTSNTQKLQAEIVQADKQVINTVEKLEGEVKLGEKVKRDVKTSADTGDSTASNASNTDEKKVTPPEASPDTTASTNATTASTEPQPTSSSTVLPTSSTAALPIVEGSPYQVGCVEGFSTFIQSHAVTLGGVGFAVAIIQLLGILFACHLARQIKFGYYST